MRAFSLVFLLALGSFGCKDKDEPEPEADTDTDTDTDTDSDTDADTDADADADADADSDADADPTADTGFLLCTEDPFEDNDDETMPWPGIVSETDLAVFDFDPDFFLIEDVPPEGFASVYISFIDASGDIDIRLYNETGVQVDSSLSVGDEEFVVAINETTDPMDFYVEVDVLGTNTCNTYDIEIDSGAVPAEDCTDLTDNDFDGEADCDDYDCLNDVACVGVCPAEDLLEENDTQLDAIPAVTSAGLMVHIQDSDWFTASTNDGEFISVTVEHTEADGDIELILRNANGTEVDRDTTGDELTVSDVNMSGGSLTYFAEVRMDSPDVCNTYDFLFDSGPVPDEICSDGIDQDFDERIDCEDYDCINDSACTATCAAEDAFEPNDGAGTATPIPIASGLTVHRFNEDWFSVNVAAGDFLTASVTNQQAAAGGLIDLFILDENGNEVDSDEGTAPNKEAMAINDSGMSKTYFARVAVKSGSGGPCTTYDIDLQSAPIPAEVCDDTLDNDFDGEDDCDDYDCIGDAACAGVCPPEDSFAGAHDTLATALALPSATGLMVHEQVPDWFSFSVAPGEFATVEALFSDPEGNVELAVFDSLGVTVDTATSTTDNETIVVPNLTGAAVDYFAQVSITGFDVCNTYDWNVTTAVIPPEDCATLDDEDLDDFEGCDDYDCLNDAACAGVCPAEDNLGIHDTQATAVPIVNQTGLSVHEQVPDWYSITLNNDEYAEVTATFVNADGDIGLRYYNAAGAEVDEQDSFGTDIETLFVVNETGATATFALEVFADDICNSYDLSSTVLPLPDEICGNSTDDDFDGFSDCDDYECAIDPAASCNCPAEDALENNDNALEATADAFNETGLAVFEADSDWYTYTVPPGATINADIFFIDADSDVDMRLYDATAMTPTLDGSFSVTDNEDVSWTNTTGAEQTVYLEVYVFSLACNSYDLSVSIN